VDPALRDKRVLKDNQDSTGTRVSRGHRGSQVTLAKPGLRVNLEIKGRSGLMDNLV